MSAWKRRKLSDSQGAKERLARKEKLGVSMVFLKSRKHWKRVSCWQLTCIHTGIKITRVLVGWGQEWQGFSRPWSHTKDCFSSLLSYFAKISLEGWMSWAVTGFGILPDVCFISDILKFPTKQSHTFSVLRPGRPSLLLTLGSHCSPWWESLSLAWGLVYSVVSVPIDTKSNITLDRGLLWVVRSNK